MLYSCEADKTRAEADGLIFCPNEAKTIKQKNQKHLY